MDLRLLGSIVILSTVTLTVVRSSNTSTTVATTSTTVATTPSQSLESPSTSGTVSLSSSSKTSSSVNSSSSAVPLKKPSSTSIPMITPSPSVATNTAKPVVSPLSSSFTSAAAHTTSESGSQSVSPTTLSQTIQSTEVLSTTTPNSLVKSVTTKAKISSSAHSPGRTTSKSITQQQLNSSILGTTSHISPPRQSDSPTSGASLGVSSQPGPSSVSPTLTVSSSLHQERAISTVVTRTTRSFEPTTQALIPSPSPSFNCAEFTVSEKDCSETCSNVGGTVEATEWCSSYSTVSANRKWKRTKTVQCKAYCSGTEAFRSLLSTVIVGILLFMISQLI